MPDDLSWALFFYAGAASVVGQSYTGAVLYVFFTGNSCSTFCSRVPQAVQSSLPIAYRISAMLLQVYTRWQLAG